MQRCSWNGLRCILRDFATGTSRVVLWLRRKSPELDFIRCPQYGSIPVRHDRPTAGKVTQGEKNEQDRRLFKREGRGYAHEETWGSRILRRNRELVEHPEESECRERETTGTAEITADRRSCDG